MLLIFRCTYCNTGSKKCESVLLQTYFSIRFQFVIFQYNDDMCFSMMCISFFIAYVHHLFSHFLIDKIDNQRVQIALMSGCSIHIQPLPFISHFCAETKLSLNKFNTKLLWKSLTKLNKSVSKYWKPTLGPQSSLSFVVCHMQQAKVQICHTRKDQHALRKSAKQ